jgi:hypothetical protein
MTVIRVLVAICALEMALTPIVLAKTKSTHSRVVAAQEVTQGNSFVLRGKNGSISKQDLFDRLNSRTDWPAPPAQPGQF